MRGMSRGIARAATIVAVLALFAAPAAFAADRGDRDLGRKFYERARRFVAVVFSRIGGPPG